MITQDHLDDLAREYHRTKDPQLKKVVAQESKGVGEWN